MYRYDEGTRTQALDHWPSDGDERALAGRLFGNQPLNNDQASGPNSMSTGVGVFTSVLNLSLPFEVWMRKTAMLSVFWLAA